MRREKQVSVARCCRLFGISRQSLYQARSRAAQRAEQMKRIKPLVERVRRQMPRLGTRKLYYLLKAEFEELGIKIGRDAFFDFLRTEHLLVRPKKNYRKTTDSKLGSRNIRIWSNSFKSAAPKKSLSATLLICGAVKERIICRW